MVLDRPLFFLQHFNTVNYEGRRASQLNRNISHLFASPKRTRKEKQLNFLFKQDVDIVTNENKRTRPLSVIHTSVMMETDAAADMDRLAKSNGGTFSVVLRDGTVVKGDTFLNR